MKTFVILLLVLLVSCGKEAGGKGSSVPKNVTGDQVTIEQVEMALVKCTHQNACQTSCINGYVACVEPCGGQNVTSQQLIQNPSWSKCQDDCQASAVACYDKEIEVTKEEYEAIFAN